MYLIRDSSYCDTSLVIKILAGWGFASALTQQNTVHRTKPKLENRPLSKIKTALAPLLKVQSLN